MPWCNRLQSVQQQVLVKLIVVQASKTRRSDTLCSKSGDFLEGNNKLYSSNGKYALQLQQDCGKLTVYALENEFNIDSGKTAVWTSWQHTPNGAHAIRGHEGPYKLSFGADHKSMCILDKHGCIWSSQSWHDIVGPVSLTLHDDGNLVLSGSNGDVAWNT